MADPTKDTTKKTQLLPVHQAKAELTKAIEACEKAAAIVRGLGQDVTAIQIGEFRDFLDTLRKELR